MREIKELEVLEKDTEYQGWRNIQLKINEIIKLLNDHEVRVGHATKRV